VQGHVPSTASPSRLFPSPSSPLVAQSCRRSHTLNVPPLLIRRPTALVGLRKNRYPDLYWIYKSDIQIWEKFDINISSIYSTEMINQQMNQWCSTPGASTRPRRQWEHNQLLSDMCQNDTHNQFSFYWLFLESLHAEPQIPKENFW